MGNRIFSAVVILLWASTMCWLLMAKIMPPFLNGEPPHLGSLLRPQIVCWRIEFANRPIGWAVSQTVPGALETTEIHSRVILDEFPLREIAPPWMSTLVDGVGPISLDTRNRVNLDTLGNLSSFDTKVWLNDLPAVIKMFGRVRDNELQVRLQTGSFSREAKYPVPSKSLLGGELTPDAKLLQIYVGRKWQKELYSPFRPPGSSLELVQAEVVEEEPILYAGNLTNAKRVEYRCLPGAGVAVDDTLRANLWVADDGIVLRQDVYLMNAKLRFERKLDAKSAVHGAKLLDLKSVATTVNEPR